jgi:hypothetical protein
MVLEGELMEMGIGLFGRTLVAVMDMADEK